MSKKKYTGKLIVVDMYSCSADAIAQPEQALEAVIKTCTDNKLELLKADLCCVEDSPEYSVYAISKHGHVMVHVYKEIGFVTADIFSCGQEADPAAVSRQLRAYFETEKARITLVDRGDFGSEADMKPHRNSKTKLVRRTKNLGRKLKKLFLNPRSM